MTPQAALSTAINPALDLLPAKMRSPEACVMLLAIGGQESQLKFRTQAGGPARGLWQFETGGVREVMQKADPRDVTNLFDARDVHYAVTNAMYAIETDDIFAAGMARLLLWCDPKPLPPIGAMGTAWNYYVRNWEPGKPRPTDWPANYRAAVQAVRP